MIGGASLLAALAAPRLGHAAQAVDPFRVAQDHARAGRWDEAMATYRAMLATDPRNVDARAGLVDVLIWDRQFDAADRELDVGLTLAPKAPALLSRRARLLHLRGDTARGRPYLDRAEQLAPADDELLLIGDRMWLGEARLRVRNDFFPKGWDDLPAAELSVLQRAGRFVFGARTEQSRRFATAYGSRAYNAFYAGSIAYSIAVGWVAGLEVGFGAPARAIPDALARASLYFPLIGRLDGYAAYSWFRYPNGMTVNMLNPVLGFQLTDQLRVDARYWIARTGAADTEAELVHSYGGHVVYRPVRRVAFDAFYVYGAQFDRLPNTAQLGAIRSHIMTAAIDVLVVRELGLRPLYEFEIRRNPRGDVIHIHGVELAVYARW